MQRRQSQLTIGFCPTWLQQKGFDIPLTGPECSAAMNVTSRNYIEVEETVEDIEDCTGQDLLFELLTDEFARLTVDFDVDPDFLAGPMAFAYGASGAPTGGTSEVQSLAITATGGTYRLKVQTGANIQRTTPLAFGAIAAAIQTALEALSNVAPGDLVVAGAAGAFTITGAGNFAKQDFPQILVETALLTGGTATTGTTTPGVGLSHPISRMATYSMPLLTLYVGFRDSDKPAVVFKNVGVDSVRIRASARGRVTATVVFVGSADLQDSVGYTMPDCDDIFPIRFEECSLLIDSIEYQGSDANGWREFEYYFNNAIRTGKFAFTKPTQEISRVERDDRRQSYLNFFLLGEPNDPIHKQAKSRPNRTSVEAILRVGPVGRNVTCNIPQGILKPQTPQIRFEETESQIALQVRPQSIPGDSTTPSNVVVKSGLATAYLVPAP